MALIDVISYSGDNNYLIYRAPQTEFSTLTQLIVHPGQEAIFVKDGVVLDILGQGRHTLHTANIPLLSKLINLPFGGESPFKCEVYFVNRALSLNYKWGTSTPANVYDQVNQLYLTVAANGTLGLQLNDPHRLLTTVAGSEPLLTPQRCLDYFRENISMKVREFIAQVMTEPGMDFLALERNLSAFSQDIRARLAEEFLSVGVSLHSFVVAQFHVPEQQYQILTAHKLDTHQYTHDQQIKQIVAQGDRDADLIRKKSEIELATLQAELDARRTVMQAQADAQKAEFETLARSRAIVAEGEAAAAARKAQGYSYADEQAAAAVLEYARSGAAQNSPAGMLAQLPTALAFGEAMRTSTAQLMHSGVPAATQNGAAGTPAAAPADNAWLAELKQLAELKRDGILSDEEFAAAKKKLLGL